MAKLQRDTTGYTPFGLLIHDLCLQRSMSFHKLAADSGMKSHASILRACRGKSVPQRENILAWCNVLNTTHEQRTFLLHAFHYSTPEEEASGSTVEQS